MLIVGSQLNRVTGSDILYVDRDPIYDSELTSKSFVDNQTRICNNDIENNLTGNKITDLGNPTESSDASHQAYM